MRDIVIRNEVITEISSICNRETMSHIKIWTWSCIFRSTYDLLWDLIHNQIHDSIIDNIHANTDLK